MGMNEQVNQAAAKEIREAWGDRFPTWDEFREASAEGRVRVNKTIAAQVIHAKSVPAAYRIFYGVMLLWIGFLSVPIAIAVWYFMNISAWWILAGAGIGWFLIKVSREGHCEGIKAGAKKDQEFYETLVENGAFLFEPKQ